MILLVVLRDSYNAGVLSASLPLLARTRGPVKRSSIKRLLQYDEHTDKYKKNKRVRLSSCSHLCRPRRPMTRRWHRIICLGHNRLIKLGLFPSAGGGRRSRMATPGTPGTSWRGAAS
eukprot:5435711-Pyramimonas_sp.AAC.1